MRFRKVVSALVFLGLLLGVGLGQGLALDDPNAIPTTMQGTSTIGSLAVVLAGGNNNTAFFMYSTTAGLSTSTPRRVKVEFYKTDGSLAGSGTVTIDGSNKIALPTASGLLSGVTEGIAVLTPVTSTGADTMGHYAGSAFYIDATFGTIYERPLLVGRGAAAAWTAFENTHTATYIQTADIKTRLHIICPGKNSTGAVDTAFTDRVQALGTFANATSTPTRSFQISVHNSSGTLVGTTAGSCDGTNFINSESKDLSANFTTGAAGIFEITGSTASTFSLGSKGDLIVYRVMKGTTSDFALDERAQVSEE